MIRVSMSMTSITAKALKSGQWCTDKLMSRGVKISKHIQISTYPFENVKIKKGWGSERGST